MKWNVEIKLNYLNKYIFDIVKMFLNILNRLNYLLVVYKFVYKHCLRQKEDRIL